jgi:hypothetical protein
MKGAAEPASCSQAATKPAEEVVADREHAGAAAAAQDAAASVEAEEVRVREVVEVQAGVHEAAPF